MITILVFWECWLHEHFESFSFPQYPVPLEEWLYQVLDYINLLKKEGIA